VFGGACVRRRVDQRRGSPYARHAPRVRDCVPRPPRAVGSAARYVALPPRRSEPTTRTGRPTACACRMMRVRRASAAVVWGSGNWVGIGATTQQRTNGDDRPRGSTTRPTSVWGVAAGGGVVRIFVSRAAGRVLAVLACLSFRRRGGCSKSKHTRRNRPPQHSSTCPRRCPRPAGDLAAVPAVSQLAARPPKAH